MSKRILVVDDDQDLRMQMSLYLTGLGYDVLEADSEASGAELIATETFDAAVLDLMMENQDSGFILGYRIKKRNAAIPVIIVSAVTRETGLTFDIATRDDRSWVKADAFINKDLRFEQLSGELQRLLGQ